MKLEELISGLDTIMIQGRTDIHISSITSDSRKAGIGCMFVAVRGSETDGHNHIPDAISRGVSAVICEQKDELFSGTDSTAIVVKDSRDALAFISDRFYGKPSQSLNVIGITGTNGKTTTSYLIKDIFAKWGKRVGVIGTIRYIIGDKAIDASFTTPEPMQYQGLLSEMKMEGCDYVISEVSSHALSQKRIDYTKYVRAIFTNLSRDHLDYHRDMAEYFNAKKRLFSDLLDEDGIAILNADDEHSAEIRKEIRQKTVLFGMRSDADVAAKDIILDFGGTLFTLLCDSNEYQVKTRLVGIPNVYNILAAVATGLSFGIPLALMIGALSETGHIEGRFETIQTKKGVLFVIDYAHTPDALDKLLDTVKDLPHSRIITVFGCGGNRDRGKRAVMGRIASEKSDIIVVTSDNPRYEDAETIIKDIEEGVIGDHISITDRREAIRKAADLAEQGDVVVVAGKGHENYQEIKGIKYHMSDKELILGATGRWGNN